MMSNGKNGSKNHRGMLRKIMAGDGRKKVSTAVNETLYGKRKRKKL